MIEFDKMRECSTSNWLLRFMSIHREESLGAGICFTICFTMPAIPRQSFWSTVPCVMQNSVTTYLTYEIWVKCSFREEEGF